MERNYVTITLCILCLYSLHRAVSIFAAQDACRVFVGGRIRESPARHGSAVAVAAPAAAVAVAVAAAATAAAGALSAPTGRPASVAGGVSITPGGTRVNGVPVRASVRPSVWAGGHVIIKRR